MDSSKVKTILIFFLLIINLLIGLVYVSRRMEDNRIEREMTENIVLGLERLGVSVDESVLKTGAPPIYMLEIERDQNAEVIAFSALLDSPATEEIGGGNMVLSSGESRVRLSGDGLFEVQLGAGDRVTIENTGTGGAIEVFELMGVNISGDYLIERKLQDGFAVDGNQMLNGMRIFNRTYELTFDSEGLTAMQGGRILGDPLVCDATPSVSTASALFAFVDKMIRNGTPCREITGASLGYYAESSAPGFTGIKPVWELTSDLGTYYVDAISLELINRHDLPK